MKVEKRYYGTPSGDAVEVVIVLVPGNVGDYAAYIGCGPAEWVARSGTKLHFNEAKIYFPQIEAARYRR